MHCIRRPADVDDAIEEALLGVVGPAAPSPRQWLPPSEATNRRDQAREALGRDLEAVRFAADRAFRQYDAADPANRLVAGELEARWNQALARVVEVESKITAHEAASPAPAIDTAALALLGANLKTVWTGPTTDARLKKRIVRTLIYEIVADIDTAASEIAIVVHWSGGVHSEIRLPRRRRGQRNSAPADVIAAVRELALIAGDDLIAGLLNRNGLKTGHGNRWTRERDHLVAFAPSHPSVQDRRRRGRALAQSLRCCASSWRIASKTLRLAAGGWKDRSSSPFHGRPLDLRSSHG